MSYLVDALRKAERERLQGAAPGKATLAVDTPYDAERSGLRMVGWAIGILVVCNLLLFGYLLWPMQDAPSGVAAPEVAAADGAPFDSATEPRPVSTAGQPVSEPEAVQRDNIAPTRRASATVASDAGAYDEDASDRAASSGQSYQAAATRPPSIPARDEVPRVHIHGHMFSANPADSFILVDGRIYHEGERLPDGVAVVSIDQEGALLDYRGRRFHVNGPG